MAQSSLDRQLDMAMGNLVVIIGKVFEIRLVWMQKVKRQENHSLYAMYNTGSDWLDTMGHIASVLDVLEMPGGCKRYYTYLSFYHRP